MTKDEALIIIKSNYPNRELHDSLCEALDMAIRALEREADSKSVFFTRAELELIYKVLSEYTPDEPDHKLIKLGLTLKIGDDLINAYRFELQEMKKKWE